MNFANKPWTLVGVGVAFLLGTSIALLPTQSEACSPWPNPFVESVVPQSGEVYPANAAVLIMGQVLYPESLTATVDGQSVDVIVDEDFSDSVYYLLWGEDFEKLGKAPLYRILTLRLAQDPVPGQWVEISGSPCPLLDDGMDEGWEETCKDFKLEYEAGPADQESPEAGKSLYFDVYNHQEIAQSDFSETCGGGPFFRGQYEWTLYGELAEEAERPLAYELYQRDNTPNASWKLVTREWVINPTHTHTTFRKRLVYDQTDIPNPDPNPDKLPADFCYQLQTLDTALNPSKTFETCLPCHFKDEQENFGDCSFICDPWPNGEPSYSPKWLYPNGVCPEGLYEGSTTGDGSDSDTELDTDSPTTEEPTSSTGNEPNDSATTGPSENSEEGCTCSLKSSPQSASTIMTSLFLLMLLGFVRKRRDSEDHGADHKS